MTETEKRTPQDYVTEEPHDLSDPTVVVIGGTYEAARRYVTEHGDARRRNVFSVSAAPRRLRGLRSPKVTVVAPHLAPKREELLRLEQDLMAADASVHVVINY